MTERLERLEKRISPSASLEPNPQMDLLLKMANHARAELDYQARAAESGGRLEAMGKPPEPSELSLPEKRLTLDSARYFLEYLADQRAMNPGVDAESIDRAERY